MSELQAAQQVQGYETGAVLYMAFELSTRQWKRGVRAGGKPRRRTIKAGDVEAVRAELREAKAQAGLGGEQTGRRRLTTLIVGRMSGA